MEQLQTQLTGIFRKHGMLRSDFSKLNAIETFKGFTSIAQTLSANQDEEVWVELESYRDRKHRDEVIAKINQDGRAGPLFGQVLGLVTQGDRSIMGDLDRLPI